MQPTRQPGSSSGSSAERPRVIHVLLSDRAWGLANVVFSLASSAKGTAEVWVAANRDMAGSIPSDVRFVSLPISFGGSWPSLPGMLLRLREFIRAARTLEAVAERVGCQIVHFHIPNSLMLALLFRGRARRVLTVHGYVFENPLLRLLEPVIVPLLVTMFASTAISRLAVRPSFASRRVQFIPNGVQPEKVVQMASNQADTSLGDLILMKKRGFGPVLLFPGILIRRKGQDTLIRAAPEILRKFPKAIFVFCGEGRDARYLDNLGRAIGVRDRLFFTGYVKNVYPFIANSDVVFSHLTKDWPLPSIVDLESMVLHKVVVTGYTDEKQRLYKRAAFFVGAKEDDDLSEVVRSGLALRGGELYQAEDEVLTSLSWNRISDQYAGFYRQQLERNRSGPR